MLEASIALKMRHEGSVLMENANEWRAEGTRVRCGLLRMTLALIQGMEGMCVHVLSKKIPPTRLESEGDGCG